MTFKLNHLWVVTVIVWLAAVLLTCWNADRIENIGALREMNEQLRKEMLFQHRNDGRLAQVEKAHASYFRPVVSATLGFEGVRNQLQMLANHLGMEHLRIESQSAQATDTQLPLSLTMVGDVTAAGNFVSALRALPYLTLQRSAVTVSPSGRNAEIEMDLNFHFTIAPQDNGENHPLQASLVREPAGREVAR